MANRKQNNIPKKETPVKKPAIAKKATAPTRVSARTPGRFFSEIRGDNVQRQSQREAAGSSVQHGSRRAREDQSSNIQPASKRFRRNNIDLTMSDNSVEIDLSMDSNQATMQIETIELSDDSLQSENSSSAAAGKVEVADNCKLIFEEIRKRRLHRYVIFTVRKKQIVVDVIGDRNSTYEQYLKDLQKGGPGECRFGLFDFEYMHQHQELPMPSKKEKLILMFWCPDTVTTEKETLYDNLFVLLRDSLPGVQNFFYVKTCLEASKDSVEQRLRADDRA